MMMRFDTQAHRIRYGTPSVVILSSDESHNFLMFRFSRARKHDPVFDNVTFANAQSYYDNNAPILNATPDDVVLSASIPELMHKLPSYEDRKKIMSSDAVASVDSFRAMVLLTYEHLFGMRFCNHCPNCNYSSSPHTPRQYVVCSNARSEGGILGRIDAGHTSIEAQTF